MAKKKIEVFEKAGENYFILGEVLDAKTEEKTSERTGKSWVEYKARIKTPEGVSIFVNKARFEATEDKPEPQFVTGKFEEWDTIIEKVSKNDRVFVSVSSRKSNEKPMYNWFTNYVKDDGQISYNANNFITELDYIEDESENIVINFEKGAINFKDRLTVFTATMYVLDIEDNILKLTDGKDEYENTLVIELPEDMENKAQLGQGYRFRLKLEKGKRNKIESGVANWGENDEVSYTPDKLIVDAVEGTIKDMTLGKITGKKTTSKKSSKDEEDELPF